MFDSTVLSDATPKAQRRVLVVEDNIALRFTLAEWLRGCRFVVVEAASADEAIIHLRSSLVVDFVVTDVQMPGRTDGFDLVDYIHRSLPGLNVIVVSGEDTHTQLQKGTITFFKKPYELHAISSHIAALLGHPENPSHE